MRTDIREGINNMAIADIKKLNIKATAKLYGCDRKTVRTIRDERLKTFNEGTDALIATKRPSVLDDYKNDIEELVKKGNRATAIHYYLEKNNVTCSYELVKKACAKVKQAQTPEAIITSVAHIPGDTFQVDWKENVKLMLINGETIKFNVFSLASCYSKERFFELTFDRIGDTLQKSIINGLEHFGGVPRSLLFDNMATVVDRNQNGKFDNTKINAKMLEFSKNIGFKVRTCSPYKPNQKATVETGMKYLDWLYSFDGKFETEKEIIDEIKNIQNKVNESRSDKFNLEKDFLHQLPREAILKQYKDQKVYRSIKQDCFVTFENKRFMVDPIYINTTVSVVKEDNIVKIFCDNKLIETYEVIAGRKSFAKRNHIEKILSQPKYKDKFANNFDEVVDRYFNSLNEVEFEKNNRA